MRHPSFWPDCYHGQRVLVLYSEHVPLRPLPAMILALDSIMLGATCLHPAHPPAALVTFRHFTFLSLSRRRLRAPPRPAAPPLQ